MRSSRPPTQRRDAAARGYFVGRQCVSADVSAGFGRDGTARSNESRARAKLAAGDSPFGEQSRSGRIAVEALGQARASKERPNELAALGWQRHLRVPITQKLRASQALRLP